MTRLTLVASTVAAMLSCANVLGAQCPAPGYLPKRSTPTRVKWTVGNLLVTPDDAHGASIWFATNRRAQSAGRDIQREFEDHFVPDSLTEWIAQTRQLLALKAPIPGDTMTVLQSGYLRGLEGGNVVIARVREGSLLSANARVLMMPQSGTPMMMELDASNVEQLLDAAETAAQRSGYRPVSSTADSTVQGNVVNATMIQSKIRLHYPAALQDSLVEGEVWARFCVNADGQPDLSTFWAPLADDPAFERSVKRYLQDVRYKPATRNGIPFRQMVAQRFVFTFRP
jgi:hypothetical protein